MALPASYQNDDDDDGLFVVNVLLPLSWCRSDQRSKQRRNVSIIPMAFMRGDDGVTWLA